ncbi:MAG: aminotransferase class I/II-fold pyridoxal phosphate-dependent enzyme, partial [Lachnospiraceae bacterium]|nr:aminotransferase class I/II-fold pyridoxal phosphate-dependent enzyme [Lachnospiraceae bacterium]
LPKYYNNTLVCYSWSKSLSLPGERMGYVLVPDTVSDSELVYAAVAGAGRSLGYVNAPSLFQRVCAACVDVTADVAVYEENKNLMVPALRDMGYHVVEPQGTFYMFPRTLIEDDLAFCEKAKDFNLLIVPGTGFGCPGHTRISYCVPTERAKRSLDAFEALAKYYR